MHDFDAHIERRGGDSAKWNAHADGILPMWVADTDFTAPRAIREALEARVSHGVFGYSDWRDASFKDAAALWMRSRFGWTAEPGWALFSPSVVVSLALALRAFTKPGDSAVFLTPTYPPFFWLPGRQGRAALPSAMRLENGRYTIDFADLEAKLARPESRLFILCNPHNPTGRVFSEEELRRLGELCLAHGVFVLSDEIHCDYVFPGRRHIPFPSLSEAFAANSLVTINPSKTFNIADLHCSAVFIPDGGARARFQAEMEAVALHSGALGILAMKTAYTACASYADEVAAYVRANAELAVQAINGGVPGIRVAMPESTFLLWLDCREMGLPQPELERFFLEKAKLALSTGTDFGPEGEGFMRMNVGCPRFRLREALARLEGAAGA